MLNFLFLKRFPHRTDAHNYAEKKKMKDALKRIRIAIKNGETYTYASLNESTIAFLKEQGYTIENLMGSSYYIRW